MTRPDWPVAAALVLAASAALVPTRVAYRRSLRALGLARPGAGAQPFTVALRWLEHSRTAVPVTIAAAGVGGLVSGGAVAGAIAAGYAGALLRGWRRHRQSRRHAQERAEALDALCAFAADLRAGLPPTAPGRRMAWLIEPAWRAPRARRLSALAAAALSVAETTGAPLAELVERIEADARLTDRAAAAAAAQAAGARATAWLLAGLPLGGVALGYAIGVDPLAVLLHTPVGAGCALTAVALQAAGLAWAGRLARLPGLDAGEVPA